MRHLISISDLDREDISYILRKAEEFEDVATGKGSSGFLRAKYSEICFSSHQPEQE